MIANAIVSSTKRVFVAPIERSESPTLQTYRLGKPFAVVHFDQLVDPAGKGRLAFLPAGAELRVIGTSRLCNCFEVMCQSQLYSVFKVDLLGPWSTPIKTTPIKSSRVKPVEIVAVGACA
jgi:hypothetical protein